MPSRWHAVNPKTASRLPYDNCVYVFIVDGRAIYVGHTAGLYGRLFNHIKALGDFRSPGIAVKYSFNRKYGEHLMREVRLIAALDPKLNKAHRRNPNLGKPWVPEYFEDAA